MKEEIKKMHTHQADCVFERTLPPPRPELHSRAMSQGLPSVDTHRAESWAWARARDQRAGEWARPPVVPIDWQRPIDAYSAIEEMEG